MRKLIGRSAMALCLGVLAAPTMPTRSFAAPSNGVCLDVTRIEDTHVIDDRTISFHMRDGTVWINKLPQLCSGLHIEGGFSYATSINELCSNKDAIQVIGEAGVVCELGSFEKSSAPKRQ